jgi:mRNA-degrading endonuclease RelE of RelBE toxin-antitoxin system
MSYSIVPTLDFLRKVKKLSKKYPSFKSDLTNLKESLLENPLQGDGLGNDCYKVRMAIESKNKGKSGGARVITCVKIVNETIYLLSIYDKSSQSTITDKVLNELLKEAGIE